MTSVDHAPITQHASISDVVDVTTKFAESNDEHVSAGPESSLSIPPIIFSDSAPAEFSDIKRYLQKPRQFLNGILTSGDVATTFPLQPMPYTLLNSDIYLSKLSGYLGFRATMVFTIVFNAERFQQGRYMLVAIPCGGANWDFKTIEHCNAHYAAIPTRTQLPRVEFDLNTESSATIKLPFSSAEDFYPLQLFAATGPTWYALRLCPYSPLDTVAGALDAKFAIWGHFEDVELVGQAITDLEEQSAMVSTTKKRKGNKSNSEKEADSAGVGPISSVTTKISKAAKILEVVPLIGSYMTPLSWAADIATSVAQVFGFSAPLNMAASSRLTRMWLPYSSNVDSVDNSLPLSLSIKNEVSRVPGMSPTASDEMSLSYIASIPAWILTALYSTAFNENQLIATIPVGPWLNGNPYRKLNPSGVTVSYLTPFQFVASQFQQYRGTICYKLKFVKTEFHQGRISINFNPVSKNAATPPINSSIASYVYRDIINIGDYTEYIFKVPYISSQPYTSTSSSEIYYYGTLDIRVVDPLIVPDTASPDVRILVEHFIDLDSEFALTKTPLVLFEDVTDIVPEAQSAIGEMPEGKATLIPSTVCVGERMLSFRSLLKRSQPLVYFDSLTARATLDSFILPYCWSKFILDFTAQPGCYADNYALMSAIFCYSRGGIRLKTSDYSLATSAILMSSSMTSSQIWGSTALAGCPTVPTYTSIARLFYPFAQSKYENSVDPLEVQVPQYHRMHSRVNHLYSASTTYPYVAGNVADRDFMSRQFVYASARSDFASAPLPQVNPTQWYRSGADDANFNYFISVPPMYIGYDVPEP